MINDLIAALHFGEVLPEVEMEISRRRYRENKLRATPFGNHVITKVCEFRR